MYKSIRYNYEKILKRFFDYLNPKLFIMGWVGLFGYPFYYFVWHDIFPQPYESLTFRLICACSAIPWLFHKKINKRIPLFRIYFFLSLYLCLPVFFSFMFIKNDYSAIWMMSYITQFFLLYLLIYNIGMIYFMTFSGFLCASLLVYLQDGTIPFPSLSMEYIPILLFMIFVSLVFYRSEVEHKLKLMAASIAHETRNPLQVIDLSVSEIRSIIEDNISKNSDQELILSKEKVIQFNNFLDLLERSSNRANLVVDILLNNIKDQTIGPVNYEEYRVKEIVESAIKDYAFKTGEANLIHTDIANNFSFKGNKNILVYVLFNLLKNALYVLSSIENPKIEIWDGEERKYNQLHFKDNGTGISKEIQKNLFESFVSQGNSNGTGLGLAFCMEAMKNIGGYITYNSSSEEGTEFILHFPKTQKDI